MPQFIGSVSKEVLETLGLNLEFGISMKPDTTTIPMDFNSLKRVVRLWFVKFRDKKEEKQYIQNYIQNQTRNRQKHQRQWN